MKGMVASGHATSVPGGVPVSPMLRGWYPMTGLNEPIRLYHGRLVLTVNQKIHRVPGSVCLDWLPTPRLMAAAGSSAKEVVAAGLNAMFSSGGDEGVHMPPLAAVPKPPQRRARSYRRFSWSTNTLLPPVVVSPGSGAALSEVSFLVVNLPFAVGSERLREGSRLWMGRARLTGGGWSVTLDKRPDHNEVKERLRALGGYATTHVGQLTKTDGSTFTVSDAEDALLAVRCTLSLATGRWVAPVLPVGLDMNGNAVWTVWRHENIDPYRGCHRLADPTIVAHLPALFAAVMSRWADPFERKVVERAIDYYVEANAPDPIELAVSAAQAGLELLAWTELVEDTRQYTGKQYKRRDAHENMSELLDGHSISTALPNNLKTLRTQAAKHHCATGPEIVTRMRNGVIHPSRSKPTFPYQAWEDAWRLVMHYLQLALLAYAGYQGTQRDPLSDNKGPGDVQQVPWALGPGTP